MCFYLFNCFVKHCIVEKSSSQDRDPCVFLCTSDQFHPSALHQVLPLWFWNTSPALQTCLVCSHRHQLPPSLLLMPSTAPQPCQSAHWVCCPAWCPTDRQTNPLERPAGGRAAQPQGAPALGEEDPPQQLLPRGAHLATAEVPATGKEFPMACEAASTQQNCCPVSKSTACISVRKLHT